MKCRKTWNAMERLTLILMKPERTNEADDDNCPNILHKQLKPHAYNIQLKLNQVIVVRQGNVNGFLFYE